MKTNCADYITDCTPQCNVVRMDELKGKNVCTTGNYRCSPPPIRVTDIKVNGLWYACRDDQFKGKCNGRPGAEPVPTSCVSLSMRRKLNLLTKSFWITNMPENDLHSAATMESATSGREGLRGPNMRQLRKGMQSWMCSWLNFWKMRGLSWWLLASTK